MDPLDPGAEDRDALELSCVQREKSAFVLEQHDRLLGRLQSQRAVCGTVDHIERDFAPRQAVEWIEFAEFHANPEHAGEGIVEALFGDFAVADGDRNLSGVFLVREIAASHHAAGDGVHVVHFSRAVSLHQGAHAAEVRNDESLVAPFVFQKIRQQPMVDIVRSAVDGVVRRHERLGLAFHDGIAEMRQPVFAQPALGDPGIEFLAVCFHIVDREVFEGGGDFQIVWIVSLKSLHIGDGHSSGEVGILAIDLVDAPPIGIPADVDDRSAVDQALFLALEIRVMVPGIVDRARFVG